MKFYYKEDGHDIADVYMHLSIDDYDAVKMICTSPGHYELIRAVPSNEIQFFFSHIDGVTHTSEKYEIRQLSHPLNRKIAYYPG